MRSRRNLQSEWRVYSRQSKRVGAPAWQYAATGLFVGGLAGIAIFFWPAADAAPAKPAQSLQSEARTFSFCHTGGGTNCVVDGDTIWLDGVKIRIADIDAPETHPARCAREQDLGDRATQRLLTLVNSGPFDVEATGDRDEDRYGRKLRVLSRGGRSLGERLVSEGLARRWDGARHPWCS